jgi:acetyl-CoA carboxylase carboxyltransferase component
MIRFEEDIMNQMEELALELMELKHKTTDEFRTSAVEKQHKRGKYTARERIEKLLDPNSFREIGGLAQPVEVSGDYAADGIVTGTGFIDGKLVCCAAYDYTILAGSQGKVSHQKIDHIVNIAIQQGCPMILFSEGGGARVQGIATTSRATSEVFVSLARASGWIPTITVICGPAFAGHANLASLTDVIIMIEKESAMGIAGPPLVKSAMGANFTPEELGGVEIQGKAGTPDLIVDSEESAINHIRSYLSYLPSNCNQPLPISAEVMEPVGDLCSLVPTASNRAYDMRKVIDAIFDKGSVLELKGFYGKNVITSFARINGKTIGIIANQPQAKAGILDSPGSDKMARFISLCDAYRIPITFLVDVPGFTPGPAAEQSALVRHSARIIYELAQATIPIYTVVIRKAYGLAYYAMGALAFKPNLLVAWPTAEFGGMGLEGAVEILHKEELQNSEDPLLRRRQLAEELGKELKAFRSGQKFTVDDVIHPNDTRSVLMDAMDRFQFRDVKMPPRRHGISPY